MFYTTMIFILYPKDKLCKHPKGWWIGLNVGDEPIFIRVSKFCVCIYLLISRYMYTYARGTSHKDPQWEY